MGGITTGTSVGGIGVLVGTGVSCAGTDVSVAAGGNESVGPTVGGMAVAGSNVGVFSGVAGTSIGVLVGNPIAGVGDS